MTQRRHWLAVAFGCLVTAGVLPAAAQEGGAGRPVIPAEDVSSPARAEAVREVDPQSLWTVRLEMLDPSEPSAYFRLAEEVAESATGPRGLALARRLYVLAFERSRAMGDAQRAASAAVALADLAPVDERRRSLVALARTLDPRYARPDWSPAPELVAGSDAAHTAAMVLGVHRAGYGRAALRLLREPGVRTILERFDPLMSPVGAPGTLAELERQGMLWPCPECSNELVVPVPGSRPPDKRACATCLGSPGPNPTLTQLVGSLRLELRLLDGIGRSWAAQVVSDFGAPLYDPDPDEVAPAFGVDVRLTVFRDGAWRNPDAPDR